MKKLSALILAVLLLCQNVFAEENISRIISHYNQKTESFIPADNTEDDVVFADLIGFEWAHQSIYALYSDKIVSGRAEGVFAPADNVKIKEFIKLAVPVCGFYDKDAQYDFANLNKNDWSYVYAASAKNSGILDFLPENTDFDAYITREQVAVICARALELFGAEIDMPNTEKFIDDEEIEHKKYVYALKNLGIISGFDTGEFMPNSNLRRCESAVIIYKLQNFIKNTK